MLRANLLRGSKLRLDTLREGDIPAMARWYEDADFFRNLEAGPSAPFGEKGLKEEWVDNAEKSNRLYVFAARLLEDNRFVGFADLSGILWTHRVAWLGIAVAPEYQGRGYGREMMQLLLRFGFHELNLHRIQLTVFSYNERARLLYESLGFRHEGTYREFLQRDGERYDMLLYGLLAQEWAQRPAS